VIRTNRKFHRESLVREAQTQGRSPETPGSRLIKWLLTKVSVYKSQWALSWTKHIQMRLILATTLKVNWWEKSNIWFPRCRCSSKSLTRGMDILSRSKKVKLRDRGGSPVKYIKLKWICSKSCPSTQRLVDLQVQPAVPFILWRLNASLFLRRKKNRPRDQGLYPHKV
jgi:hypothetical protein